MLRKYQYIESVKSAWLFCFLTLPYSLHFIAHAEIDPFAKVLINSYLLIFFGLFSYAVFHLTRIRRPTLESSRDQYIFIMTQLQEEFDEELIIIIK
jgi:hypothetical protein